MANVFNQAVAAAGVSHISSLFGDGVASNASLRTSDAEETKGTVDDRRRRTHWTYRWVCWPSAFSFENHSVAHGRDTYSFLRRAQMELPQRTRSSLHRFTRCITHRGSLSTVATSNRSVSLAWSRPEKVVVSSLQFHWMLHTRDKRQVFKTRSDGIYFFAKL